MTGGGGFLGSAIVRLLVARGEQVRTVSRNTYPELDRLGVTQIKADLTDADAVAKACKNIDAVFHVAARPGIWGKYEDYYQANTLATRNVIDACGMSHVSRLIYTSSPSVIFDGKDMEGVDESVPYPPHYEAHYPKTKALAEKAVLTAARNGLATIILRPHLIWGPGDPHIIPRLLQKAKRLRRVGDGTNKVDTIYIDNAAKAHIMAEERLREHPELAGRVYFISQDDPIELWRMIDLMLAAGGKPPVTKSISPALAYRIGALLEQIYGLFRIKSEPPITRFVANEFATAHWFNMSAAKRDLGYRPEVSIAEGLERLREWLNR